MSARLLGIPLVAVLVIGAALGILSAWFDSLPLDTPLIVLVAMANAIGPWLVAAFAAGALAREPLAGAAAGAVALIVGVIGYYVAARIIYGDRLPSDVLLASGLWIVAAICAGVVLGAAGGYWTRGGRQAHLGVAVLAGGLLAEAAYRFISVEAWTGLDLARTSIQVGLVDGIGAIVVVLVLVDRRSWLAAFAWSVAIGVAGLGLLSAALAAMDLVRFGGLVDRLLDYALV